VFSQNRIEDAHFTISAVLQNHHAFQYEMLTFRFVAFLGMLGLLFASPGTNGDGISRAMEGEVSLFVACFFLQGTDA
jgi:hypothetical protein